MQFYRFVLGILSVWRITHLLQAEDGPWDSVVYLRQKAGDGFSGELLDCFYCLSVWSAFPFAIFLGKDFGGRVLLWPALSAGAILLERFTEHAYAEPPTQFSKESEDNYVLWQEAGASSQNY
ncbi:MAG: DUF1360 domain-containing protein [Candidatus Promineifilaceae bacterium]|jgi:hypothetical protein